MDEKGENILEFLPVQEYDLPKYKPFETSPEDNVFMSIHSKFANNDELRPNLLGTNFSKFGIATTNAHILLFTPYRGNEDKAPNGNYCHTKKCVDHEEQVAEAKYPEYKRIVPTSVTSKHLLNAHAVYNYLKNMKELGLLNEYTQGFGFDYPEGGENSHIGFNAIFFLMALEALIKLGHSEIEIGFTSKNRAAMLYPAKASSKVFNFKEDFVLIMPMMVDDWGLYSTDETKTMGGSSYNLETNCFVFIGSNAKYCFDIKAIKEKKKEEKTKKIETELQETKSKLAETENKLNETKSVLNNVIEADKTKLEKEEKEIAQLEEENHRQAELLLIKDELDKYHSDLIEEDIYEF